MPRGDTGARIARAKSPYHCPMRGAQPDAECPRCHHRQPPGESSLAHCAKCGLTFQAKEIQVRPRPPTAPPSDVALVPLPPRALKIENTGAELTYRWSEHPEIGSVAVVISIVLLIMLWSSEAAKPDKIWWTAMLSVISALALQRSRPSTRVAVDKNQIHGLAGTVLLADVERIDVDGGWIVARIRHNKFLDIARTKDVEIAAYVGAELARRLNRD